MRAWTIVLFILAIHACLAMINVANIADVGLNVSISTSGGGILVTPGSYNVSVPSSKYFNESVNASTNGSDISNKSAVITRTSGGFVDKMIESITGAANTFLKFMDMFTGVLFSIHEFGSPIFGDFNAWVLEGMVDIVFGISLFQMITGRSFKTME
jgi:hypothetical protein